MDSCDHCRMQNSDFLDTDEADCHVFLSDSLILNKYASNDIFIRILGEK